MKFIRIRRLILLLSFLGLPVILNYFSPVLVVIGLSEGIFAGAFFVFGIMFISSLLIGRSWCAYICPFGGLQMITDKVLNKKLIYVRYLRILKYLLGCTFIIMTIYSLLVTKHIKSIDLLYHTEKIGSVDSISALIRYYIISGVIFIVALLMGRRGACHYICPMAILNILGSKIKNKISIPSLNLRVDSEICVECKKCNDACPMSLDVSRMVREKNLGNAECILCGECSTICKSGCIEYGFGKTNKSSKI